MATHSFVGVLQIKSLLELMGNLEHYLTQWMKLGNL